MRSPSDIKYIVLHVTAGYSNAAAVQSYFTRPKSQGGRGWRTGGYHRIVELDGKVEKMYDFSRITNGVAGYNEEAIHIATVGGLLKLPNGQLARDARGNFIGADTRTYDQKIGETECVIEAINWLAANGKDVTKDLMILGHRDFSIDSNRNGVIEPWERIKDCPCRDVIPEFLMYSATNYRQILPSNR